MEETIFTKIVRGEIPCYKITETENCLAFLDINPRVIGHTLVIPKIQIDNIFDVEEPIYSELFDLAKKVSKALKKSFDCKRIGMSVIGLEVPHAHIHLLPINRIIDMNFENLPLTLDNNMFNELAFKVKQNY